MATLNPNEFDAFTRGEPVTGLQGKVDNSEFDSFYRGEIPPSLDQLAAASTGSTLLMMGVG